MEAFEHYQKVFGGEFNLLMRYDQMPGADASASGGDRILHVALPIGVGLHLQGSDFPDAMPNHLVGNNFAVVVNTTTEEESQRIYDGLAAGEQATMPLSKTFWSPMFGMCTDKFGIAWMVSMA